MSYIRETQTILNIDALQTPISLVGEFIENKRDASLVPLTTTNANLVTLGLADGVIASQERLVTEQASRIVEHIVIPNTIQYMSTSFNISVVNADLSVPQAIKKAHAYTVSRIIPTASEMLVMCNFEVACSNLNTEITFILADTATTDVRVGNTVTINNPDGTFRKTIQLTWNTTHLKNYPGLAAVEFALYYSSFGALPAGSCYIKKVTWAVIESLP